MAFERIQSVSDRLRGKRYASDGDGDADGDIDELASAQQWADQTKRGLFDRARDVRRFLLAFGWLAFLALLTVGYLSSQYFPGFYREPLVLETIKWGIAGPVLFVFGMKLMRQRLSRADRLTLFADGEIRTYFGTTDQDSAGNLVFHPVKGFDVLGLRGRDLTLGDLPADIALSAAKDERDPDEQAAIRVEDATVAAQETALGTNVAALSDGLEYDPNGRESDVYAQPANLADEQVVERLKNTLRELRERIDDLEQQNGTLERERNEWRMKFRKRRDSIIEDHISEVEETNEAVAKVLPRNRGGSSSTEETSTTVEAES